MAGLGAIAMVMIFAGKSNAVSLGLVAVLISILFVLFLAYGALRRSGLVAKMLGRTDIFVVTPVPGVLLAALSVPCVVDGIWGFVV